MSKTRKKTNYSAYPRTQLFDVIEKKKRAILLNRNWFNKRWPQNIIQGYFIVGSNKSAGPYLIKSFDLFPLAILILLLASLELCISLPKGRLICKETFLLYTPLCRNTKWGWWRWGERWMAEMNSPPHCSTKTLKILISDRLTVSLSNFYPF
jgi:hypothetical protein